MALFFNGISLRPMEPRDIDDLYQWENDSSLWNISDTMFPFSKEALRLFIESSISGTFKEQFRLMIDIIGVTVGCIDLFDISAVNHHASIGILLYDSEYKRKGVASIAVNLLEEFAYKSLEIHSIKAEVSSNNIPAMNFFKKMGYIDQGVLTNWKRMECGVYSDVHIFQHNISQK